MSKTNLTSWRNQFIAGLTGDSDTAIAEKAWRGAKAQLTAEIALLDGQVVMLENKVDDAKDALEKARVNYHQQITPETQYIANLLDARNKVIKAEKEIKEHNAKIEFLKSELDQLLAE